MKNNSIALGGLFACLHVLLLFVGKLVVGSELLMALILPLLSTIYTLKTDGKSVVMFSVATILVCCLFDFISTFIYVVPSLICGVVYGALRKRMFKELELLCITGLVHVFTIAFSFFVIVLFFKEVDFLDVFEAIFSLKGENLYVASLLFLFVLGFSEAFVIHFISDNELERFANRVEKNEFVPKWFLVGSIVSLVALIITYFLANLYSVFPMLIFAMFFVPFIIEGIINLKYKIFTISLICVFSLIAIFSIKYIEPLNYIMLVIFVLSPFIVNNFNTVKEKTFKRNVNKLK